MADAPTTRRSCGECTVCCDGWLHANIFGREIGNGVPCHFCRSGGCSIYENRPEVCRTFECGWKMDGSVFPEAWRPDLAGFVIQSGQWAGGRYWILRHAGRDPAEHVLEAMRRHTEATGEPHAIVRSRSLLCYGKPEFQRAMVDDMKKGHPAGEFRISFFAKP